MLEANSRILRCCLSNEKYQYQSVVAKWLDVNFDIAKRLLHLIVNVNSDTNIACRHD